MPQISQLAPPEAQPELLESIHEHLRSGSGKPMQLPKVNLAGVNLAGMNLTGADLSGADLSNADLSDTILTGANLANTRFFGANLSRALLNSANLFNAEFSGANLTEANLEDAEARQAGFGMANLQRARLSRANLNDSTISLANLPGADLANVSLKRARIRETKLQGANLNSADLRSAQLSLSQVRGASFKDADLRDARIRMIEDYQHAEWIGCDVRDVNFAGGYMLRRFIMDQNYLMEYRQSSRGAQILYYPWLISCDCGRSLGRWCFWIMVLTVIYGGIFKLGGVDFGNYETWFSPYYFSIVTLTTLGYGDVVPSNLTGQIIAASEVFLGYLMLGGLLSIFSNKIARRAD
ncbi:MAG: pentapeptide repeat-containing protein [bacterium]